jgi:hypothetical protein
MMKKLAALGLTAALAFAPLAAMAQDQNSTAPAGDNAAGAPATTGGEGPSATPKKHHATHHHMTKHHMAKHHSSKHMAKHHMKKSTEGAAGGDTGAAPATEQPK